MPALLLAFAPAFPADAQQAPRQPTTYDRAIAAGYKAAMLCGAILNAQAVGATRSRESVEAYELKGIYPEYDPLIGSLAATIERNRVLVRYDPVAPPRIAESRGLGGCTNLPVGTPATVPPGAIAVRRDDAPAGGWPLGDSGAPAATLSAFAPAVDAAFTGAFGKSPVTTAVVVLRDGNIVAERYAPGFGPETPQRTWSVAKSIAGTLVGIAVKQGMLDPAAPAPVPEWQKPGDPRAAITLDNLLRMASGLHSDTAGNRTDAVYFGGTAVTEETVNWQLEAPPGTRFRYANNDTLLAVRALRSRFPPNLGIRGNFARSWLFAPIGMAHTIAEQDWKDNYILSSQVWASARDLARLGQFWLQDGVWNGVRILPEGWMQYMTAPSGPQPDSNAGWGYGATLWLAGPSSGLPEGSYAAQGNRGQTIVVVPAKQLVIVRRGEDRAGTAFDVAAFARAVVEAAE